MNKKLVIVIINFIVTSAFSQDQMDELSEALYHTDVCDECIVDYNEKDVETLFSILKRDLKKEALDSLWYNDQISFSFCRDEYKNQGFTDCFYIIEFKSFNENSASSVFKELQNISKTTIHYKPPQFWRWLQRGEYIYMIYSNTYELDSPEFDKVENTVIGVLGD